MEIGVNFCFERNLSPSSFCLSGLLRTIYTAIKTFEPLLFSSNCCARLNHLLSLCAISECVYFSRYTNLYLYFCCTVQTEGASPSRPRSTLRASTSIQFNSIFFHLDKIQSRAKRKKPMLYTTIGRHGRNRESRYLTRQLRIKAIVSVRASEKLCGLLDYMYVDFKDQNI